jgi:hypothetical protein
MPVFPWLIVMDAGVIIISDDLKAFTGPHFMKFLYIIVNMAVSTDFLKYQFNVRNMFPECDIIKNCRRWRTKDIRG